MPGSEEERSWNLAVGENTVSAYRDYLRYYSKGRYSRNARRIIARRCLRVTLCVLSALAFLALCFLLFQAVCEHFAILLSN